MPVIGVKGGLDVEKDTVEDGGDSGVVDNVVDTGVIDTGGSEYNSK